MITLDVAIWKKCLLGSFNLHIRTNFQNLCHIKQELNNTKLIANIKLNRFKNLIGPCEIINILQQITYYLTIHTIAKFALDTTAVPNPVTKLILYELTFKIAIRVNMCLKQLAFVLSYFRIIEVPTSSQKCHLHSFFLSFSLLYFARIFFKPKIVVIYELLWIDHFECLGMLWDMLFERVVVERQMN